MGNRYFFLIFCAMLALPASGCSNGTTSGSSSSSTASSENTTPTLSSMWNTSLGTSLTTGNLPQDLYDFPFISSPAIAADGTIYVGSTDGSLYAINDDGTGNDGDVIWRYQTGGQIVASPAIGTDGTIYVGSADRQLYAIKPNGRLKWVFPTKAVLTASPAIAADGTIYVAGTELDLTLICPAPPNAVQLSSLYAINPDGTSKWSVILSGSVNSSPVIASDGTIYIGSGGDMRPQPKDEPFADPPDKPQISYDRIDPCDPTTEFPASDANAAFPVNGHVYAINPNGSLKWDFKALGDVESSAAIGADGTIYIGSKYPDYAYLGGDRTDLTEIGSNTTGYLYAIDPDDGTCLWYTDLYGHVKSSPAIGADGTIYVGSDKEDVFAVNPTTGAIAWQYPTRGPVRSSPAIAADGTIYIGSADGNLYRLNPDGTLRHLLEADGMVTSSPTIRADGTLYFATTTETYPAISTLYAFMVSSPLAETIWPKFRWDLLNSARQQ